MRTSKREGTTRIENYRFERNSAITRSSQKKAKLHNLERS
jgi:hypothetical protein